MSIKEIEECFDINRARRKRDQHWDMAGMARQDGDIKDMEKHTELAKAWSQRIGELL